jgi:DNA-binding MarR family transcriptional regulator
MSATRPAVRTAAPKTSVVGDDARLYLALGRIYRALRRDAAGAPVGPSALSALASIVAQGPIRLGELAQIEGVAKPSMTRIVAALEETDAVVRTPDPTDRRATLVEATRAGRRMIEAGRAARMVALRRRMERLGEPERAALVAALPALEALTADDASPL